MADPYADLGVEEDDAYGDLGMAQTEPPAARQLPLSGPASALRTLAALPLPGLSVPGAILRATGALEPGVVRPGAPEVGPLRTTLNKAANALPAGGFLTDMLSAGSLLGSRAAGAALPDSTLRSLAAVPGVGQLTPAAGPGARLTPQARKELEAIDEAVTEPAGLGLLDTYRGTRDERRKLTRAGEEQNPLAGVAGTGAGLGLSMFAPLPKFTPKGGEAAGTLARMSAGAKTGGLYGGLAGLTSGGADLAGGELQRAAAETGLGLLGGGLLGGAIPGAVGLGQRLVGGLVKPTAAARALQEEGVEGLTLGQMDPKSALGAIEGTAQATPGIGTVLQGQREKAVESLRRVALTKAVAPGATPPAADASIPEAIGHIRKGFDAAYSQIDKAPVPTLAADRLLLAVDDPGLLVDDAARLSVSKFLQNQMSLLPKGTDTTAGVLTKIRSNIRKEAFKAQMSGNTDRLTLLERAEAELTSGLSENLPVEAAKALRATDAQYRNFKILQDAAASAGDTAQGPGMFTTKGLSSAVDRATGDTSYAELGGGPLRRLSSSAAQAFAEPAKTGWSALGGPWVRGVTGPLLIGANRPSVQPYFLGQTPLQKTAQEAGSILEGLFSGPRATQSLAPRLNTPLRYLTPQAYFEALQEQQ